MITDFIFDGQELSGFGYIICDFDGVNGTETHSVAEKSFTNIKSPLSNKSHVVATSEDENLNRKIQIMKNPCDNDLLDITNDDLSELSRWLCREDYKLFKWVEDKDDDEIFYEVQIKLRKIELAGGRVGVELDITANAPHGFTREFKFNHSASASASSGTSVPVHTYESIKDTYTSGTWQDYSLEIIFGMTNGNYEYYRRGFENLPASLDSSKYYFMYVKGYNLYITYINTSDYGCLFAYDVSYDDDVNTDYSVSLDRMIGIHSSYMDRLSDSDSISTYITSTLSACCSGTFTTYSLNCYKEDYDWECVFENEEISHGPGKDSSVGGVLSSAVLVATNMDLFSNYEFGMYSGDNGSWRNQLNEMTYDEVMEIIPNLTVLNQNLPYYDGQKVVGENKDLKINVFTDEEGYIYPDVVIKIKQNGNLELVNEYENRTTYIADCKNGEVITITGGDTLQITSSDDTHDMSSCFNYKFPRLCAEYRKYTNKFSTNLTCDITMKYKGIRKVGL